ncbi:MAG TPA: hypothetical protein VGV85_08560 [Longimicrobiaceae bacterium]|nr:hypothetical protein [Longimicrobiaceae bacterium]
MTKSESEAVAGCFAVVGMLAVTPALLAAIAVWEGFALKVLWGWFVVPAFNAPALGWAHAVGLSLIAGLLVMSPRQYKGHEQDSTKTLVSAALAPAVVLAAGWLVKLFA